MKMGNRFLLTLPEITVMNSIYGYIKIPLLVLLILFSFTSYLFPQNVDSLVGNWELIKNERQWDVDLRFEADMSFYVQRHLSAKYSYKLNADTLISFLLSSYPDSETIVDTSLITVKTDTIVRTYNKSGNINSINLVRDKSYKVPENEAGNPLIGRWKWVYPSKDTAVETFYNNQTWDFSVTGRMNEGYFEVDKDTLTMIYNDKKKTKKNHTFWIQQDMMGIRDLKTNKEYLYRRTRR